MTWTTRPRSNGFGGLIGHFAGHGPRVVLLHGVGLRAEAWGAQVDVLSDHRFSLEVYDMPGHGAAPRLTQAPGLQDYTDHLAQGLFGPGIVVGHSMGAMIALDLAMRYPKLVHGVVAMNAIYDRSPEAALAVKRRAAALDGVTPSDPTATLTRWFEDPALPAAQACAAWLRQVDPGGYRDAYTVFASENGPEPQALRQLRVPALFLTGAQDPNSTPAMSHAMAALAPKGQSEIIDGAAHMLPMTHPGAVNARLRQFFEEVL